MMADVIRTSMFCEFDEEPWTPMEIEPSRMEELINSCEESTPDVYIKRVDAPCNYEPISDNSGGCSVVDTSSQNVTSVSDHQTPNQRPTCTGILPTDETCFEFWARIMIAAKVDLSTFNNLSPDDVFSTDYLHSVVAETLLEEKRLRLEQCSDDKSNITADEKKGDTKKNMSNLPYTYAAITAVAIYTSGKESLTVPQIVYRVSEMFPECPYLLSNAAKKTIGKNIRKSKLLVKQRDNMSFRIQPGQVYMSTFCRKSGVDKEKYPLRIQDYFRVPNMLEDLGLQVVTTKRVSVSKMDAIVEEKSKSVKRKCGSDVTNSPSKRSCLKLPVRPCFHDDNSNHRDDELLNVKDTSIEESLDSSTKQKSSFRTSTPVEGSETDSSAEKFVELCASVESSCASVEKSCALNGSSMGISCAVNNTSPERYCNMKNGYAGGHLNRAFVENSCDGFVRTSCAVTNPSYSHQNSRDMDSVFVDNSRAVNNFPCENTYDAYLGRPMSTIPHYPTPTFPTVAPPMYVPYNDYLYYMDGFLAGVMVNSSMNNMA